MLNSLEHEKNLAVIKSDKEWTRSAEGDINVVSEALNVFIIVVMTVFVAFGMHHIVATQPKVQALLRKCQHMTRLRCPCLQHLWARRRARQRQQQRPNAGVGVGERGPNSGADLEMVVVADEQNGVGGGDGGTRGARGNAMVLVRNPSFRQASGDTQGGAVITRCVSVVGNSTATITAAAAAAAGVAAEAAEREAPLTRPPPWMRRTRGNSCHNISPLATTVRCVSVVGGEGKGDDGVNEGGRGGAFVANGDLGRAARSKARSEAFFKTQREKKVKVDEKAARNKEKERSQMSPEVRREAEEAEKAVEDHGKAKDHMIRHQMKGYKASAGSSALGRGRARGRGRGRGRGGGRGGGQSQRGNRGGGRGGGGQGWIERGGGGRSDGGAGDLASRPGVNIALASGSVASGVASGGERVAAKELSPPLENNVGGGDESIGTPVVGPVTEILRVRQTMERVDSVAFGVAKDVPLRSVGSEINVLMHSLGTFGVVASGDADTDGAGGDGGNDSNADVGDAEVSEVEIDGSVSSSDESSVNTPAENTEAGGEWLL